MEYTEEEKKAIKEIENFIFEVRNFGITSKDSLYVKYSEFLLKLVEKQQKEIEELKGITQSYNSFVAQVSIPKNQIVVVGDKRYFDCGYFIERYIPKGVIREKIKEIEERIEEENEMLELNQICKEDYESRVKYLNYALNIYKRLLGDE